MDQKKIGRFIYNLRVKKGLSQNKLAEMIPISRQAVSNWELGKSIPDSGTLIILSRIFNVTINELLLGEKNANNDIWTLQNITLDIIDEKNKKEKKFKRITKIFSLVIIVIIILFLAYYFINSYNSIRIYKMNGIGNNFITNDGIFITTKQKIYFRLGKLIYDDDIDINKIKLYYVDEINEKKIIFSDTKADILITDFYGYEEYFSYNNISEIIQNIYLEIQYNDSKKEIIKINVKKDFANNKLFFKRNQQISQKNEKTKAILNEQNNNEIEKKIKEKWEKKDDSYVFNLKKEEQEILFTYFEESDLLILEIKYENKLEEWTYYTKEKKSFVYTLYKNNKMKNRKDIMCDNIKKMSKEDYEKYEQLNTYITKYIIE